MLLESKNFVAKGKKLRLEPKLLKLRFHVGIFNFIVENITFLKLARPETIWGPWEAPHKNVAWSDLYLIKPQLTDMANMQPA